MPLKRVAREVDRELSPSKAAAAGVKAAFGEKNRARLINDYFASVPGVDASNAWQHIYRLLLWIDDTIGLAHCYESDKSQPGRHWYPRALLFHDWVATALGVEPNELAERIDWLFRHATQDMANYVLVRHAAILARAASQRAMFAGKDMPEPGEDPELTTVIVEVLGSHLNAEVPPEKWRQLAQRVRQYIAQENKRKNLVGEGFEDVLKATIARTTLPDSLELSTRRLIQSVPGFKNVREGEKPNKVDLVVLRPIDEKRVLVTAKWSIRADREQQFPSDFSSYLNAKSDNKPFDYVLVTNEFDPARLANACERMAANHPLFSDVVHINTDALLAVYGASPEASMAKIVEHIKNGRLSSLAAWLPRLVV